MIQQIIALNFEDIIKYWTLQAPLQFSKYGYLVYHLYSKEIMQWKSKDMQKNQHNNIQID